MGSPEVSFDLVSPYFVPREEGVRLLAGFKVPKRFIFGPIPKTSTGKIQKYILRERAKSREAIE